MNTKEVNPINKLNLGYYAFANNGRVVELELQQYSEHSVLALFSMSRLGPNDERIDIVNGKGCVGVDVLSAVRGLGIEERRIVMEYAKERQEVEYKIKEAKVRLQNYEKARSRTANTGRIPAEYVLFKSDRM